MLFNQPIGSWNMAAVADLSWMFYGARSFNQPVGSWDVSAVVSTTMEKTCSSSAQCLQPTTVGSWDTSQVKNMNAMFDKAFVFNQPIGTWNTAAK